jgi:hypothetical protein
MHASAVRVRAIAGVRLRRVLRTRIALAGIVLALLPWVLVDSHVLLARLAALAEFSVVGLTVVAAGAIADDVDSGEYAIALSHDASPFEILVGQAVASLALVLGLVAIALPIALWGTEVASALALTQSLAWLLVLLTGWLALALLFGTLLEGKANAVAMGAVLVIAPLLGDPALLDRLPNAVAATLRAALHLVPHVSQATAMFGATLDHTAVQPVVPAVLLLSPILYLTLAAVRLARLEPAGRLTQ